LLFVAGFLEMIILDNDTLKLTTNWTKPDCNCLPGCNELSYSSSMTYGNIDSSFEKNMLYANGARNLDKRHFR
jgi:hypothetical protein